MKISTKVIIRLLLIGTLHATVFLWLIPFVIIPGFDDIASGSVVSVVVMTTVVITAVIFFYPVCERRRKSKNKDVNFQLRKR